jgi:hypothetical protein
MDADDFLIEKRFYDLFHRYVGFELFDRERARLVPEKTYIAIHGQHVLLRFSEQAKAEEFFAAALKAAK